MNYPRLDGEVSDLVASEKRRFNNQVEGVFNTRFIHDIMERDTSFGSSCRLQSDHLANAFDE